MWAVTSQDAQVQALSVAQVGGAIRRWGQETCTPAGRGSGALEAACMAAAPPARPSWGPWGLLLCGRLLRGISSHLPAPSTPVAGGQGRGGCGHEPASQIREANSRPGHRDEVTCSAHGFALQYMRRGHPGKFWLCLQQLGIKNLVLYYQC